VSLRPEQLLVSAYCDPRDRRTKGRLCTQGVKLDDGQTLADLQLNDGEFLVAVEARKKPGNNNGPPLDALATEPSLKLPSAQVSAPLDAYVVLLPWQHRACVSLRCQGSGRCPVSWHRA